MYENEDSFIRITCDNFDEFKNIDIIAFSIADLGACGSPGSKVIVDSKGNIYDMRRYDCPPTEEQFLSMFPVFRDYHPVLDKIRRVYKSPGWTEKYMGLGNHLFVRDDFFEKFDTADKSTSCGELYTSWIDTAISIIQLENKQD